MRNADVFSAELNEETDEFVVIRHLCIYFQGWMASFAVESIHRPYLRIGI